MRMDLDAVEHCFHLLLAHARKTGVTHLNADNVDMYWTISSPECFLTITPSGELADAEVGIGSLHDDISELHRLLEDPTRASGVDLDRLASVLRLLSCQLWNRA